MSQTAHNLLLTALMTLMGLVANVLHTVADRLAMFTGRPATSAGFMVSVYAAGSLVSVLLSSGLSDRVGKRRMMNVFLGIMCVGFALIATAKAEAALFIGLFLFGFGFAPAEAMISAVVGDENPGKTGAWMNVIQAGFGLGAIIGPLVSAWWLTGGNGFPGLFVGSLVITLAFIAVMTVAGRGRMRPPKGAPRQSLNMFGLLKDRRMTLLVLTIFLYLGYEGLSPAYIKQHFLALKQGEGFASAMISVFWGVMIIGRLLGALRSGHELRSIRFYAGLSAVGAGLLAISKTPWLSVFAAALLGFGCGPTWPMLMSLATGLFPGRTGSAVGLMMLGTMCGMSLFPWLIGTLPGNLAVTFGCCVVLALGVGAVSHFSIRQGEKPQSF